MVSSGTASQGISTANARIPQGSPKTSSSRPSPQTPPRASAQEGPRGSQSRCQSATASPAFSSASTADGEASPELPPLPAPRLPDRVLGLLRTPPTSTVRDNTAEYDATHWGSPYPKHLRSESVSSEASEESPIHQIELQTPFLRPVPLVQGTQQEAPSSSISAAAAVLANRARRVHRGITEDWIRQHTAGDSDLEKRHWLSDGAGDSENSSLSGSFSGEEAAWLGFPDNETPRANRQNNEDPKVSRGRPRKQSSSETLKALLNHKQQNSTNMASFDDRSSPEGEPVLVAAAASVTERPSTPPMGGGANSFAGTPKADAAAPATPSRAVTKRAPLNGTPRLRKKVPWKGKNIMVSLPRDEERGQPGKSVVPLGESAVKGMLRSWEQLGYNISGFDLNQPTGVFAPGEQSQSRGAWPDFDELVTERKQGSWKVLLPDLNGKFEPFDPPPQVLF